MVDRWKTRPVVPKKSSSDGSPPGWYSRGYLPHFDGGEIAQMVTFNLHDALPQSLLNQWSSALAHCPKRKIDLEMRKRIQTYLDRGLGHAWMNDSRIAKTVEDSLLFFDGSRYKLQAWVVMPNHVHALLTPGEGEELGQILHSWKSYTAKESNKLLGRAGDFWQSETFDRFIRNEEHYRNAIAYIENNPVRAGLCKKPEDWPWSSARMRKEKP
jgi:putative DNA methylase